MIAAQPDVTTTQFTLPPDAKFLPVAELSPRLRSRIGPVDEGQAVITRPGFRVTTRLVPGPLAELITEFRAPSLITDAVARFARVHDQDASVMLDLAFDALATLIEARILVPAESADASAPEPSLAIGQEFAGFEIEALVRSLEDSEVYRARGPNDVLAALKIARDDRPRVAAMLVHEASMLARLDGTDTPRFFEHGTQRGRAYIAMEWCDGVSIAVAAQQLRASRDRPRLHELVGKMLGAYGRLHGQGVLHGDIHQGNCMVRDDGRVVILDFGNACAIAANKAVDPLRAGIPHFYDPLMARTILDKQMPPAADAASEQYAIAVLAYLLLTGLMPIDSPAQHEELLLRIVQRHPLPFAARAVPAWPEVEAVLTRALAKTAHERFADVAGFARAFAAAGLPSKLPVRTNSNDHMFDTAINAVKNLSPSPSTTPAYFVWFALRASLALQDAELLAAAGVLAVQANTGWAEQAVVALVARASSDSRAEGKAIAKFLASVNQLPDGLEANEALLAAANILDGARMPDAGLATWAAQRVDQLIGIDALINDDTINNDTINNDTINNDTINNDGKIIDALPTYVALMLAKAGTAAVRTDLRAHLELLGNTNVGNVWLWALAHDVFTDDRFKALALAARLPRAPFKRAMALLRLHQLTGDMHWVAAAHSLVAQQASAQLTSLELALIVAEIKAPERAVLAPFMSPF